GLSWQSLDLEPQTAKFDLSLVLSESARGLETNLEYNTDLFEAATISRLLGHWHVLLEAIVTQRDQLVGQISLLTEAEREEQLLHWNATDYPFASTYSLSQLFEQQVERTPDAVAVIFEQQQLTYRALDRRANQIAHYLHRLGVGPDQFVGIAMERSLELVVALLGILKAGGVYLPLDPDNPIERLTYMLEDAHPVLLLTQSRLQAGLPATSMPVLCVDQHWRTFGAESDDPLAIVLRPEHLAYVIYTSGSTGRPKGAMITQRGICHNLQWMQATYRLTAQDGMLQKTSFSFDASVWELFCPLIAGARLVLARPGGQTDLAYLLTLVKEREVTTLFFAPSALQAVLEEPDWTDCRSIRQVLCGGEALASTLRERFFARTHAKLSNLYGPTEATIHVTYLPCEPDEQGQEIVPIGRPITNTRLYVLDTYQELVPVGVTGELYIGGIGLARGYHLRPDLTAERFVPHPWSQEPGQRLYRTGDLVRYRADGMLEFQGRIDQQVKLRGFRIELGEIEAVLRTHPAVQEAVVLLHKEQERRDYLLAYVVLSQQEPVSASELRAHAQMHMPDYMVPARFLVLDVLPLTTSGKIDRRALPAPKQIDQDQDQSYEAPRTSLEELLAQLWAELLQVAPIGRQDNFFELGGHSLLATQLVASIRQTLQLELSVRTLFEAPTIASLASALESIMQGEQAVHAPALVPLPRPEILPLSFAQERLWFLDQLDPQNATYNMPIALHLSGWLSLNALEQSLGQLVQRHETLRTIFPLREREPVQQILESVPVYLPQMDLQSIASEEQETWVHQLLLQEVARPFDLQRGPLWRGLLIRLGEQQHVLLVTMHHSIADGWSLGVLIREISSLYQAVLSGKPFHLPPLPIQYADYALWQRAWLQGEVLERQLHYWQQQLAGAPALLKLPTDHSRPAVQRFIGAQQRICLPAELLQELKALSQREGVTLFMTLLASFQVLLMRYSGQEDLVIGVPIANRTHKELEELIGFFVNTLVLRTDLSGNPGFRQLLQRVREVALQAYANQDVPFEKIVEALQVERSLSYTPLFQVLFTLQNLPSATLELAGLSWQTLDLEQRTAKFDLNLVLSESERGLETYLEYNTDLFEPATISRLLDHWRVLLEEIVSQVEQPIAQIPLLTAAEREQQLLLWNATEQPLVSVTCFTQLFAQQVMCTPDAIAVISMPACLTYQELDRRANQLAHYLQGQGVGPDRFVGVALERSQDLIVALLGILKAGGAYLPLDPDYPGERLAYMLQDARPLLLISQQDVIGRLPTTAVPVCLLDSDWTQIASAPSHQPLSIVEPQHLAYMLYTSGSTGRPKGTMITQQGLLNYLVWATQTYAAAGFGSPVHSPLGFDLTVTSLFTPLLAGRPVWLLPRDQEALLEVLQQGQHFSLVKLTPAHLTLLNSWLTPEQAATSSHALVIGGEALLGEQVRYWQEHAPETRLINEYGPTETVVGCCVYEVPSHEQFVGGVPIGRPIANTQLYVLDAHLELVPIGVTGELYIGGIGLARGYHRRPELTAERFVPHPFSQEPGQRLYRTGDLVRYRADGVLEFQGRIDAQIKLRGFRIELGEIEAVLCTHPAVREALVLLREEAEARPYLLAYVVPRSQEEPLTTELLQHFLRDLIPDYMIPTFIVVLSAFPLTDNGKVDQRALPVPQHLLQAGTDWSAPQTPVEQTLAAIWQQILKVERIGLQENFFALGGDSILSLQVVARARQAGLQLTPKQLFQHQTIAQLALVVTTSRLSAGEQGEVHGPVPLTPIVRWFFERALIAPHHYNQTMLLQVPALWNDVFLLQHAMDALLAQHDVLRSRFAQTAEGWQQRVASVAEAGQVPVERVDLSVMPSEKHVALIEEIANQTQASLDLEQGPLLRVVFFSLGEEQPGRLLIVIHHLVVDGVSWRVLLEDLQTALLQLQQKTPVVLPPKTASFQSWAQYLHTRVRADFLQDELSYWLTAARIATAPFPCDLQDGDNTIAAAHTLRDQLTVEETAHLLHEAPAAYRCQLQDLLLVALVQ
ncbi:MAG TPA: amino acid adenylation domain-containing protein, partial [Ktedonobacteraceae bacterium]